MQGREFSKEEPLKRIKELLDVLLADRNNKAAHIALAMELARIGKYERSIKFFSSALSIEEDYLSLYNLGSLYYKLEDFKNAIICLERSKSLNPSFVMSYLVLGLSYSRRGDLKAAKMNFIQALMKDPSNRVAITGLSILFHNSGRYLESMNLLSKIPATANINERLLRLKSEIFFVSGNFLKCKEELKNLKKVSDRFKSYDAFVRSVPVAIYDDKFGTLEDKISRLQLESKTSRESMIKLSLLHLFTGNTDEAIDCLFEARGV